jgi:hypothetical protein
MSFDLYNYFLKIQESNKILTPKMGAHLGMCEFISSHSLTFPRARNVIAGRHFWFASLQSLALIVSSRLGLQHLGCKP